MSFSKAKGKVFSKSFKMIDFFLKERYK